MCNDTERELGNKVFGCMYMEKWLCNGLFCLIKKAKVNLVPSHFIRICCRDMVKSLKQMWCFGSCGLDLSINQMEKWNSHKGQLPISAIVNTPGLVKLVKFWGCENIWGKILLSPSYIYSPLNTNLDSSNCMTGILHYGPRGVNEHRPKTYTSWLYYF